MSITDFLLARIAEDEEVARDAGSHSYGDGFANDNYGCLLIQPARILAECQAKRAIVELHAPVDYSGLGMKSPNTCTLCGADRGMGDWEWIEDSFPCPTIRTLAAVYVGHEDYRDEWKVGA